MDIKKLLLKFQSIFNNSNSPRTFFAPGRINLIGEHTDYNGGYVFPASISFGTYALAQIRDDQKVRFYSLNFPTSGIIECDLSNLSYNDSDSWGNYPKGMLKYMKDSGLDISRGMDILYYGDIPNSAGLSSSASIEMVTGILIEGLFDFKIDRLEMIQLAQKVENDYIGVNSGIMDQFAIGKGKKGHAILLNCQTLDYKYAPLDLTDHVIIIINTNKKRALADSKYNVRRSQCEEALTELQTELSIEYLGDLTKEQFEQYKHLISDETIQKRAKHVVYENERTLEARQQLQFGNLVEFGKLMNESHRSLQHDYEVTGIELDTIVETAWDQPGVVGARMTGAGFGGCAIAIVEKDKVNNFKDNINNIYEKKIGYSPSFYTATVSGEAKEITEGVHN